MPGSDFQKPAEEQEVTPVRAVKTPGVAGQRQARFQAQLHSLLA
jgi:hypothetical protein